jgi:hypothetical protein
MRAHRLLIPFGAAIAVGCADPTSPSQPAVASFKIADSSGTSVTGAPVRLTFPGQDPGPPFYSEMAGDFLFHTEQEAAVVFWRQPECVPDDFNLLVNLDLTPAFPDGPPRPFLCPLTVEGVSTWHDPATDPFPYQVQVRGSGAVPIWFVAWPELQGAIGDGMLTIAELAGLPSLQIGYASFYQESVRNSTQGQRHPSSSTVARGTMADGGVFRLHVSEKLQGGERDYLSVQIEIGGK